jgi:integrase
MTKRAGIGHWHAHEGRHTAVSIMSHNGVPIQDIADAVDHKSTHATGRIPPRNRAHHKRRRDRDG